jgi:nicotinamide-nucleotide amidase
MNCELVMIGSELLLGQIVDTNASYLAKRLAEIGLDVYHKTTVGDNLRRLVAALGLALERSDVVITSGGLGPTEDDLTREAVAEVVGVELEFHQDLFDEIEAKFSSRGLTMSPNNRKQAFMPRGATVISNPFGTAPAFVVELENGAFICLPGVPGELKQITEVDVVPYLSSKFVPGGAVILSRELKASAVGESTVDHEIGDLIRTSSNPTVGILAKSGEISIRMTAKARDPEEASRMLDNMESRIRERVGDRLFGKDDDTLDGVLARLLESRGKSLCVVETGTGGAVAQKLVATNSPCAIGFEVLPRKCSVEAFLSTSGEHDEKLMTDPRALAGRLAEAARAKYSADIAVVVLEATRLGLPRSWVLVRDEESEYLRDVGLKGCDSWSQQRLAIVALEMTRRVLLRMTPPRRSDPGKRCQRREG